ncbi:MAG TPA: Gfo/Idh/MocA family oxidoreductase [Opitutaceae bacterium]|nr:Gfo/Idh/MocA family oxidoreductase [Opitutaceae bacterium]
MSTLLNWGILSTGNIAGTYAKGVARSQTGRVVAVASRELAKARAFAAEHRIERAHGSYEALLADPGVQAVYIATPHPQHLEWVMRTALAGKHVLCEKPMTMNLAEARTAAEACRASGVLFMEAFMYRCHPQTAKIVELIRDGALGRVELVQATFSYNRPFDPAHRVFNKALGGGGILDVGCYPVSLSRLVAGAAGGQPFLDPEHVDGVARIHPQSATDVYAAATLGFANGIIAQVSGGIGLWQERVARIYGSEGWLHVPEPFILDFDGGDSKLILHRHGASAPEEIVVTAPPLYTTEADAFGRAFFAGAREAPAMPVADSLGNMATLDRWRAAVGLAYDADKGQ